VDVCRQPAGAQARARRAPHNAGKFKSKQLLGTVGDLVLTLKTKKQNTSHVVTLHEIPARNGETQNIERAPFNAHSQPGAGGLTCYLVSLRYTIAARAF
jgi:hypothetical protein